LYFQSDKRELHSIALNGEEHWHTPLQQQVITLRADRERVYVGTDQGELIVLDAASGDILASHKIVSTFLIIDYADQDIVIASSENGVYGREPFTGDFRWEYSCALSIRSVRYFKGVVTFISSGTHLSVLEAERGKLLWQCSGTRPPEVFVAGDSLFIIDENGVKQYGNDLARALRPIPDYPIHADVLTALANALISKGELTESEAVLHRVATEIDADYPPLRAASARLEKAKGNAIAAARELAAYAGLIGRDSKAGQQTMHELQRDHGLGWCTQFEGNPAGDLMIIGNKLIGAGRIDRSHQVTAFDPDDGLTVWRRASDRFCDAAVDAETDRIWHVSGKAADATEVTIQSLTAEDGLPTEIARWNQPSKVNAAAMTYANESLFVATVSSDVTIAKVTITIRCFTTSGAEAWRHTEEYRSNEIEMEKPLGIFTATGEYLVYSAARTIWTLSAMDGAVVREHRESAVIAPFFDREGITLYFTSGCDFITYDLATGTTSARLPVNGPLVSFIVRNNTLYATDGNSVFSPNWRVATAKDRPFLRVVESESNLYVLRNDAALVQLDPATGNTLAEHSTLWRPASFCISGNTLYAITPDRSAFARRLNPCRR